MSKALISLPLRDVTLACLALDRPDGGVVLHLAKQDGTPFGRGTALSALQFRKLARDLDACTDDDMRQSLIWAHLGYVRQPDRLPDPNAGWAYSARRVKGRIVPAGQRINRNSGDRARFSQG